MPPTWHKYRYITPVLFAVVLFSELAFGIYLSVFRDFVYYDAVSRVANAFYVLYSRDPHLGAIGFVWNPLPSLLELVPLLLWPIIPEVATAGLAANILTSLFAAGTAAMLFRHGLRNTNSLGLSLLLAIGYACNPFIFLYGANGMSEAMFSFFIVWLVIAFTRWIKESGALHPIQMSFALALGFWIRYEAVALGAALALSICFVILAKRAQSAFAKDQASLTRENTEKMESTLLVAIVPAFFSGIAWIGLNYIIMGDPLYFFRSGYSNLAFVGNLTDQFRELISSPSGVLWLVLRKSAWFSAPLIGIILIRFLTHRWKTAETAALVMLAASIPAMQYFMLLNGSSFGWLRFFVYSFTVAAAWLPYEFSQLRFTRYYRFYAALLCVLLFLSAFVIRDMNNQELSPDEYETFNIEESGTRKDLLLARQASQAVDRLIGEGIAEGRKPLVLTDSYSAYSVLLNTRYPHRWIITNDRSFEEALRNLRQFGVDYILISRQKGAVLQIIHEVYPTLFEHGTPWAQLVLDLDGEWRLFRILEQ